MRGTKSGTADIERGTEAAQFPVQQSAASSRTDPQEAKKARQNRAQLLPDASKCETVLDSQVPPRGNAHHAKTLGKSGFPSGQRAKSSAVGEETPHSDPDLEAIVDAWPTLSEAIRAGILAMIRAAE